MSNFGYDKDRFPNLQGDIFDCLICSCVVKAPKECNQCGNLFCTTCIDDWLKKNATCPNRCNSSINPMSSVALAKIYKGLEVRCSKCPKMLSLSELDKHQQICGKPRCWNQNLCSGFENTNIKKVSKPCCSLKCQFLLKIVQAKNDHKLIYQLVKQLKPPQAVNTIQNTNPGQLKWDSERFGTGVTMENNKTLVILKEQAYVFRSVVGNYGFTSGVHYWEIIADSRTENELKIGISTSNSFDMNTAFCDAPYGWAFYGLGQLRHASNASGPQFGKRFKKEGVLGVYLNMDKGILAFSLNGESMGVAYETPELCKGPIYPAASLLHCAACTIRGQLPVPSHFSSL